MKKAQRTIAVRRKRRKMRVRKKVFGTAERPRLTVTRSLKHIYAQIIDDDAERTLCDASTRSKSLRDRIRCGGNRDAAAQVGVQLAERAQAVGIVKVCLDRNGYRYHGRVKSLADAARQGGLEF